MDLFLILILILPELFFSFLISIYSYSKHRYLSLLYNSITSIFFILALVSEIMSYLINMDILILGRRIILNVFLRTSFITLAFVFWMLSINYLTSNRLSLLVTLLSFIGGGIIVSSLFETDVFSSMILAIFEVTGLVLVGSIIIKHLITSIKKLKKRESMSYHWIYLSGIITFLAGLFILIFNGLLVYKNTKLVELLDYGATLLIFTGIFLIMSMSALYPNILATTYVTPYSLFLVTTGGETFFEYTFKERGKIEDPELIGSAMTGISMMTGEIIGSDIPMRLIEHEAFYIIMAHGKKILGFLFTEEISRILRESLEKLISIIERKYGELLENVILLTNKTIEEMQEITEEIFYYLL